MSSNNNRKCAKCGITRAENSTVSYHTFPDPGTTNFKKAYIWAKYCWPNEDWTSVELLYSLHKKHKVLCGRHFDSNQFYDNERKKLSKFAVPGSTNVEACFIDKENICPENVMQHSVTAGPSNLPTPKTKSLLEPCTSASVLIDTHSKNIQKVSTSLNVLQNISVKQTEATGNIKQTNKQTKLLNTLGVQKLNEMTPRELKLYKLCRSKMREIIKLRNQVKSKDIKRLFAEKNMYDLCELNMSNSFVTLLQSQLYNCPKKPKGRRYTLKQKIQALIIYKKSPACYRLLRRMFTLPCQSSLIKLLNKVPLKPGINNHIFSSLKKMSNKNLPEENICILAFDEMSIRKHILYNEKLDHIEGYQDHGKHGRTKNIASKALVFMLIGLRKKWKQPIAFYFSHTLNADRLTVILKEVLMQCFQSNLNVVATVCDVSTINMKAIKTLGSTSASPCFNLSEHEIVTILDPPHLLKCTRNLLMKHDINITTDVKCNEQPIKGIVKWSHIQTFYSMDKNNPNLVYAPQLTDAHLRPNCQQQMRVKLAAQVFSNSVTMGMLMKIAENQLPAEASATATFVQKFDNLFDAVNADSPDLRRGKKYSTNITNKTSHLKLFSEMKHFINTMTYIGSKFKPPSQEGWIYTINSIEKLWKTLQSLGVKSLSTRRLNQDPLENCFGCVRYSCGSNNNPNVSQFISSIKTAIISNLKHSGKRKNCEDDSAIISNNLSHFLLADNTSISDSQTSKFEFGDHDKLDSLLLDAVETVELGSSEGQACGYVCGFIFKKLKNKTCLLCRQVFLSDTEEMIHLFTSFKEYDADKTSLNYVNKEIITCVEKMANIINNYLKVNAYKAELKKNILNMLDCVDFTFLNKCVPHLDTNKMHLKLSTFFIIVKRFCILSNRDMEEEEKKKAFERKLRILKNK